MTPKQPTIRLGPASKVKKTPRRGAKKIRVISRAHCTYYWNGGRHISRRIPSSPCRRTTTKTADNHDESVWYDEEDDKPGPLVLFGTYLDALVGLVRIYFWPALAFVAVVSHTVRIFVLGYYCNCNC